MAETVAASVADGLLEPRQGVEDAVTPSALVLASAYVAMVEPIPVTIAIVLRLWAETHFPSPVLWTGCTSVLGRCYHVNVLYLEPLFAAFGIARFEFVVDGVYTVHRAFTVIVDTFPVKVVGTLVFGHANTRRGRPHPLLAGHTP